MATYGEQTRRGFLAESAKLAAVAGLVSAAGCGMADRGPAMQVVAGPKPRRFGPNDKIRFGIIGAGNRCNYVMKQLFEADKNISIKAVAEPVQANVDRALKDIKEALNETPDIHMGAEDYRKLLERNDIDAILTATPCNMHAKVFLACFAAGKHVYGEKPMAITVNETDAMIEAQKKNPDTVCQIGFQRRGTTLYPKGIELIRSGRIGRPMDVRAAWNNAWGPIGKPTDGHRSWFGRRSISGDWMLEQACHTWDVLNWVAGKLPVAATGIGYPNLFKEMDPERDVTDLYYAHIEYPEFYVDYEHSWICPHHDGYQNAPGGRFTGVFEHIGGLKGGVALNEGKFFPRDPEARMEQYTEAESEPNWTRGSVGAFMKTLRGQGPNVCTVNEGRAATLVGLLVRRAVYEHRRVTMNEIIG
ncbi:MAG TPA: Gfo/Idh/MocA family oxidoreductase [Phycisphaerae bacterium]|nr:Gfo/Idh/MocA family oxidoreductase [Phycisphaerae bacterium]